MRRLKFSKLREGILSVVEMLLPRYCVVCGRRLAAGEHCLCTACTLDLPYTRFGAAANNPVEILLHGRIPFERASAFLFYEKGARSSRLVLGLKYYGRMETGLEMGRRMAVALRDSGFFSSVDCIVPVPLSARRLRRRGYNQSEWLARGVGRVLGIPVVSDALRRMVDNPSQTSRRLTDRMENVQGIFSLVRPDRIEGRHVLLLDDVVTTGATLTACSDALLEAKGVRISVLALAVSGKIRQM